MSYLLDTNVVSEVRRSNANPKVRRWFDSVSGAHLYLSVLVLGEIRSGISRLERRDPEQAEVFESWLRVLRRDFASRLLPITGEIAEEWGRMGVPSPLPAIDGLMAATAKVHGLTLATRNTADFARAGISLVNPFE